MATGTTNGVGSASPLSHSLTDEFRARFNSDPHARLARNCGTNADFSEAALSWDRNSGAAVERVFSVTVPEDGKPVTWQKSTGRCWIFAALNCMRLPFMKENKLSEFEFSQSFLYFWHILESSNYFLENILATAREDEDSRIVQYLLATPIEDGGQYDMVSSLISKYGVVPKSVFQETKTSLATAKMRKMIKAKLRACAFRLRKLHTVGSSMEKMKTIKEIQIGEIFRILSTFIGTPPDKFSWRVRNKDKSLIEFKDVTPLEFYEKHCKEIKPTEYVSLINDPRNEFRKLYTVDKLGNVIGAARPVRYINLKVEELKKYAKESLEDGEAVWFGVDVGQCFHRRLSTLDLVIHDFELLTGPSACEPLTKAERLRYADSLMTHAMVLTAVDIQDDKTTKWRVENSWGDKCDGKGYLMMTDEWFSEYVYQIVVHRKRLPKDILDVYETEPVVLPAWDPMGSLA
eukprot:818636_1